MFTCGWIWIYAGCTLMLAELVTPGFVLCFFGAGAATVGVCRLALGEALTPTWQVLLFSVLSIAYLVTLRRNLKRVFSGEVSHSAADFEHEAVGRLAEVREAIRPPLPGRVLMGDAEWTATADEPLDVGTQVKVVSQSNLTLQVAKV